MISKFRNLFLLLPILLVLYACTSMNTSLTPAGVDLDTKRTFYVVKHAKDGRGIHELIRDNLKEFGFEASSGLKDEMPDGVDVIVTYRDFWGWDLVMYMKQFLVTFKDTQNSKVLARGDFNNVALIKKSPKTIVKLILGDIFNKP